MQGFTYGHLKVTVAHADTGLEIALLREGMARRSYSGHPPSRGWAALRWRDEQGEAPKLVRSSPGTPSIETISDEEVLLARLYLDRENTALRRRMSVHFEDMPARARYELDAIDVLVRDANGLQIFLATHDSDDVQIVLNELRRSAHAVRDDLEWSVRLDRPPLIPESDLFLWMLYRWDRHNGRLGKGLRLTAFNSLSARNTLGGITRSLRGIDLDRIDTLGAAAEGHELGPGKFVIYDRRLGLVADMFLLLDGTFDLYRRGTEYDEGPLDRAELGLRATIDVATSTLPRLRSAYSADKDWASSERSKFTLDCNRAIIDRYS